MGIDKLEGISMVYLKKGDQCLSIEKKMLQFGSFYAKPLVQRPELEISTKFGT